MEKEGTIYDLMDVEHAYAPPYSSAKDPVNMAGFVADNILNKTLQVEQWDIFENNYQQTPNAVLIDVRDPDEFACGAMNGAINIPVDTLRSKLNELPKDAPIFVYCAIGLRGYLAQRILLQNGFKQVSNLSGGYTLWNTCKSEQKLTAETIQKRT